MSNRSGWIDPFRQADNQNHKQDIDAYQIYLFMKDIVTASDPNGFKYDLLDHPEDICFRVSGRNMLGRTFSSNVVVVVPRATLQLAISRAVLKRGSP